MPSLRRGEYGAPMSDSDNIILDTATRLFADLCTPAVVNETEAGKWPEALWTALQDSGLTLTWVPESLGGAGADMADGFAVLRAAGSFAVPVPLAETLLAGLALARAEMTALHEPMTIASIGDGDCVEIGGDGKLTGAARQVPFARSVERIVVPARENGRPRLAVVAAQDCSITPGVSLAGEPRDAVRFDGVTPQQLASPGAAIDEDMLIAVGAAVRCSQMAGALQRILDQSVQYATERVQFGKPIAKFQAIQHSLAELAGEAAAARAAAGMGEEAIARGTVLDDRMLAEVAAAKIRVGEAAGRGAAIAHQVHGAMGFTYEHTLHHSTRRLWSWRDDFGNEAYWSIRLGKLMAEKGADELWPFITAS